MCATTPHLRELATSPGSVYFHRFYAAAGVCSPTRVRPLRQPFRVRAAPNWTGACRMQWGMVAAHGQWMVDHWFATGGGARSWLSATPSHPLNTSIAPSPANPTLTRQPTSSSRADCNPYSIHAGVYHDRPHPPTRLHQLCSFVRPGGSSPDLRCRKRRHTPHVRVHLC